MVFTGYRVSSKYGWRVHPIQNTRKFHAGIDLVKEHKSLIKCFVGGTVLYAGNGITGSGLGGYGNVVVIKDVKGYTHVYAHLNSTLVKKGQAVSSGVNIGRQGATGQVTGSHLHYEIRKKSSPSHGWSNNPENTTVDPTEYVKNYKGVDRVVVNLKVDGKRGIDTIKRWQQFFGTPVDGVISSPSVLIKEWQKFLNKYGGANLVVDGYEGYDTIKESQKFFGTKQDGKISKVSPYIKELQRFLNSYGR